MKYDEMMMRFGREDLVSVWVADMDLPTAQPIVDAIQTRAANGIFGYTARPELYFDAMQAWYQRRYDFDIKKESLIHSPGVLTAMSVAVMELTEPGDKIMIQTPVYPPFFDIVQKNKRVLVENPLKQVNGKYEMDYEDLEQKMDGSIKFFLLCNPHNPVGRVWSRAELIKLGEICCKHGVRVIADEIHGDIVFGGKKYIPFASIDNAFHQNQITCLSATKTFNIAGLQASFVIVPDKQENEKIREMFVRLDLLRNNCFSLVAVQNAYQHGEEWLEQLLVHLEKNAAYVLNFFKTRLPQIQVIDPEGTYLMWLDCRSLGLDDKALARFMIDKAGVALNAGIAYGQTGSGFMRINIACPQAILARALENIADALSAK